MGRSVSAVAARAVKNSQKGTSAIVRTPYERLSALRSNIAAKLYITVNEAGFLLEQFDALAAVCAEQSTRNDLQLAEINHLKGQIDEFRAVYEQENQTMAVKVERILSEEPNVEG